ncbi:polyprenyl synthetase family protein [Cellulomonas fimi]|uniref:Polyprenyl synthetase n=1 Tax=Cellulomonas fimi (strain ATCC 484 / DSM 20113 / JCM 1341 / CCUG 24087 / LMG 16345 / NBRC 15513 / NCIMB 8980 / NCTC 7547 / NRS-133) TaxID=590998 RepID=F4GZW9_CELFA|nr:polyprenyl synthetase family protein [Cellulomonas fimi]AEE47285.1 Polyprenyl synthetase [Cellulomonas fimi ATCC 484]NNH06999.1 polyprenyl synthetase family protein [Cellulomonas fimi]VEH35806.1 Farnesyl diphosphate synthase [Cellulomonas fimi]
MDDGDLALAGGSIRSTAALAHAVEDATRLATSTLQDLLVERAVRAGRHADAARVLWEDLASTLGGKLMRPRLTAAAYLGLGGTDLGAVAPVAAAQEVLHVAMLVHDDVLDHDDVRRGRLNVSGAARRRGLTRGLPAVDADAQALAAGILAGDLALASAFRLVARTPVPGDVRERLTDLLADGVETAVAGELLDVASETLAPADVDALLVAALKTAEYSCRVPLASGAVLAGADEDVLRRLDDVAAALGLAFQLTDDDLGVFGDPAVTGKSVLSDLRRGKRTELLRVAYDRSGPAGRATLDRYVGQPDLDEEGAALVRAVMVDSGALAAVRTLVARTARAAREHARALPEPLADYLVGVVDDLVGRGH